MRSEGKRRAIPRIEFNEGETACASHTVYHTIAHLVILVARASFSIYKWAFLNPYELVALSEVQPHELVIVIPHTPDAPWDWNICSTDPWHHPN